MENKKCFNCYFFQAYYTKIDCSFYKTDCGRCLKHKKVTGKSESCNFWVMKNYNTKVKWGFIIGNFGEMMTKIDEIYHYINDRIEL